MGLKSEKIEQMSKIQEKVVFDLQQLTVQNRLFDQILLYLVMSPVMSIRKSGFWVLELKLNRAISWTQIEQENVFVHFCHTQLMTFQSFAGAYKAKDFVKSSNLAKNENKSLFNLCSTHYSNIPWSFQNPKYPNFG